MSVEKEDKILFCRDCGEEFIFSVREQDFYAQKGFENDPVRCSSCRATRKRQNGVSVSAGGDDYAQPVSDYGNNSNYAPNNFGNQRPSNNNYGNQRPVGNNYGNGGNSYGNQRPNNYGNGGGSYGNQRPNNYNNGGGNGYGNQRPNNYNNGGGNGYGNQRPNNYNNGGGNGYGNQRPNNYGNGGGNNYGNGGGNSYGNQRPNNYGNGGGNYTPNNFGNSGYTNQVDDRPRYPIVCANCGIKTEVPFVPRDGVPVFCRTCYNNQKPNRN